LGVFVRRPGFFDRVLLAVLVDRIRSAVRGRDASKRGNGEHHQQSTTDTEAKTAHFRSPSYRYSRPKREDEKAKKSVNQSLEIVEQTLPNTKTEQNAKSTALMRVSLRRLTIRPVAAAPDLKGHRTPDWYIMAGMRLRTAIAACLLLAVSSATLCLAAQKTPSHPATCPWLSEREMMTAIGRSMRLHVDPGFTGMSQVCWVDSGFKNDDPRTWPGFNASISNITVQKAQFWVERDARPCPGAATALCELRTIHFQKMPIKIVLVMKDGIVLMAAANRKDGTGRGTAPRVRQLTDIEWKLALAAARHLK